MAEYSELPLSERLWPDSSSNKEPRNENPHYGELPLSYRLWPDAEWPPKGLRGIPSSEAVRYESDRLFSEYYEKWKDDWD